jgi:hypothetical protein
MITIQELKNIQNDSAGIRYMTANPLTSEQTTVKVGDELENSFDWEDGISVIESDGVSALNLGLLSHLDLDDDEDAQEALNTINERLERLRMYMAEDGGKGQIVILSHGSSSYEGNDLDERVICGNPEVLHIVKAA